MQTEIEVIIPYSDSRSEESLLAYIRKIKSEAMDAAASVSDRKLNLLFGVHRNGGVIYYKPENFFRYYIDDQKDCEFSESDQWLWSDILSNLNFTITFTTDPVERGSRGGRRGGRFWRYVNQTTMDLSILGIYNQIPEDFNDVCFISSLKQLGYDDEQKLNSIKTHIRRGRVTNDNIKKIANELGVRLIVHSERKIKNRSSRSRTWNNPIKYGTGDEYELVETEDHYMPMWKFPDISKHYLKNYLAWKDTHSSKCIKKRNKVIEPEDLSAIRIRSYKNQYKNADLRADTKDIVTFLMNTPGVQRIINADELDKASSYFNKAIHFETLNPVKGEHCEQVHKNATVLYKQTIEDMERQLTYNPQWANSIRKRITKFEQEKVLLDQYGNKFVYPLNLPSKYKQLYNPDTKYESSEDLRMEFLAIKNKRKTYIRRTLKDANQSEVWSVPFNKRRCILTEQYQNIYLDLECGFEEFTEIDTAGKTITKSKHIPYCICYVDDQNNQHKFKGPNCIVDCLNTFDGRYRIYCHNMKYEIQFIFKHLTTLPDKNNSLSVSRGNGTYYQAKGYYQNPVTQVYSELFFKDSYKLISQPLSKFGKIFQLQVSKDICPYDLYTIDNIFKETESISKALQYIKPEDKEQFKRNVTKYQTGPDEFKHIDYSVDYCILDCIVTKQGVEKFREWIYRVTLLDIHDLLTIASVAHNYFIETGCYNNCYKISNVPRHFIQRCVVGGRVMCRDNTKQRVKGKIQDFDAVSLYPSAMYRIGQLGGFLQGKPILLQPEQLNLAYLNQQSGYFIEIQVTETKTDLHMPLLSTKDDDGIRTFTNQSIEDDPINIYVDKFQFEDLIKFQEIEYTIIRGYSFNSGRNNTICSVIQKLFNERLYHKGKHDKNGNPLPPNQHRTKNPIETVYKLMMNSSYGKTIQRAYDTKTSVIKGHEPYLKQITDKYFDIKTIESIEGSDIYIFDMHSSVNQHFSLPHVGSEILAMSKRIMNEVICTAEEEKIPIWYTDTDSMHINHDDIPTLELKFESKYQRKLIGKTLGQFHSDFDSDKGTVLYSIELIALTKKVYIDKLLLSNNQHDYHIRMKGISKDAILAINQDPMKIYEDLYNGLKISFNLCANRPVFEFKKGMGVNKVTTFIREIQIL